MVRINLNTIHHPPEENKLQLMDELLEKAIADLRSLSIDTRPGEGTSVVIVVNTGAHG